MIKTNLKWTVYMHGKLFDVMTDDQVVELIQVYRVILIDAKRGIIEF
jgi:hypothetical protein